MIFYAAKTGPDPDALKLAFQKCGALATANQCTAITIAVPTKGNLQGIMDEVLGEKAVAILLRDNALRLGPITLYVATERVPPAHRGPVLAAWTNIKHITTIVQSHLTTDIVYLPWLDEELVEFRKRFPQALPL